MDHYQKIAVFGGVYNNYLALEQLLRECQEIGVDAVFCLGDMGGFGPHPDRCFPFLRIGKVQSIAGNYDISLAEGQEDCGCGYTDARDNHFAQISYEYTFENTSEDNKAWLGNTASFPQTLSGSTEGSSLPRLPKTDQRVPVGKHFTRSSALKVLQGPTKPT